MFAIFAVENKRKMNKIIFVSAVSLIFTMAFCSCTESSQIQNNGVISISEQEFTKILKKENATVIDVRTPAEVSQGYIKGTDIFADISSMGFEAQIGKLDPSKAYIVYCRSGSRSSSAANFMVKNGFKKVYNLEGGMLNWKGDVVRP